MSTPGLFQKCHLDTMCSDYGDYYGCQNISYHRLTLKWSEINLNMQIVRPRSQLMVPVVANLKLEINSKKVLRDPSSLPTTPPCELHPSGGGEIRKQSRAELSLNNQSWSVLELELRLQGNFLHTGAGTETECSFPRYAPPETRLPLWRNSNKLVLMDWFLSFSVNQLEGFNN